MLYLHCGWPRTGTSSLQFTLAGNRRRLVSVGLVYPDGWNPRGLPAHHGLTELLSGSFESDGAFEGLVRFLSVHVDEDVLLSAESLTNWLLSRQKQEALLALLAAVREAMPTRCVWTLRRLDDLRHSLYLLRLARDGDTPGPDEHFASLPAPDLFFEGMRRVEDAVDDVAYVEYHADGAHNYELLRAFDMPEPLVTSLGREIERGNRLNMCLSRKQVAVLLNVERLSARLRAPLDPSSLRAAFHRGELNFDADGPCEVIGEEARRELRVQAVDAARAQRVDPYVAFFGAVNARSDVAPPPRLEELTDSDLQQLAAVGLHQVRYGPRSAGRYIDPRHFDQ